MNTDYGFSPAEGMGSNGLSGSMVGNYTSGVQFKDSTTSIKQRLDIFDWLLKNHDVESIRDKYIVPSTVVPGRKSSSGYSLTDLGFETFHGMFELNLSKHYIALNDKHI